MLHLEEVGYFFSAFFRVMHGDLGTLRNRFAGLTLAVLTLIAMLLQVSLWEAIESSDVGQAASAVSTFSLPLLVMFLTEKYLARTFRT